MKGEERGKGEENAHLSIKPQEKSKTSPKNQNKPEKNRSSETTKHKM